MKNLVILFLLAVWANPAKAERWMEEEQWTLRWLGDVCGSTEVSDQLVCGSYLQGVFAGQQAEALTENRKEPRAIQAFCRPRDLTIAEMTRLVASYALEHPNAPFLNAHDALAEHFAAIWPCEQSSESRYF